VRFRGKFDLFVGLHFSCRLKIMLSSYSSTRTSYIGLLQKLLSGKIENVSQSHICLWDTKIADYKNTAIKKIANEEIETHFGLLGDFMRHCVTYNDKRKITIKTSLLTTAVSRPGCPAGYPVRVSLA